MENSFMVSPMRKDITLKAGETYEGYILVAVPAAATESFDFETSINPYSVSDGNNTPDFATRSNRTMMTDWITIENGSGTVEPNETKKINFTIKVPETAPAGGQYAMIGVASRSNNNTATTAVTNTYEMASLIYAQVEGETVHAGKVVKNQVPGFVATGAPTTELILSNDGNVHETAISTVKIKNALTGSEIAGAEAATEGFEILVMPETTRTLTRNLDNLPALGIFEVEQTVEYLGETSGFSTVMVVCPIWFIALVIMTICSLIGMICYGRHLKKKKLAKTS